MKKEHLFLLQCFSLNEVYLTRILHEVSIISGRLSNLSEENSEAYAKMICAGTRIEFDKHLHRLLTTFRSLPDLIPQSSDDNGNGL